MPRDADAPQNADQDVPLAVLDATRSLLWLDSEADARKIAEDLVIGLGGTLVTAAHDGPTAMPADISFGEGEPMLPAAAQGSPPRALLTKYLGTFLLDAQRALELTGRTARLAEAASQDMLTGLPNRRMLARSLARLGDGDTVILLDLDFFKRINDDFGHAAGDRVLRAFGTVLRANVRGRDIVGRYGGEEFIVVLAEQVDADAFLQRLRVAWTDERPYPISFSAGIASFDGSSDSTVAAADAAMYRAKESGRDCWLSADPPHTTSHEVGHRP